MTIRPDPVIGRVLPEQAVPISRCCGRFAPGALLEPPHRHAESAGYLAHEFGDSCLLLASATGADAAGKMH